MDPMACQSREGNLLSLSGPSIPKAQIAPGSRFSAENMLQVLFTYVCLPASSSDLCEREQGRLCISNSSSYDDGNDPRVKYQPLHSHEFLKFSVLWPSQVNK